jgi:hypothetical protein
MKDVRREPVTRWIIFTADSILGPFRSQEVAIDYANRNRVEIRELESYAADGEPPFWLA